MLGKTRLHMCTINDNYMMYGSWYMERDGQNCLSFWTVFCPFTALTTKNPDHMQYCSWDTMRDGCNSNLFWAIFCPFISLTVQKITIKKKMKETPGDVIILQQCSKNHDHMLYCSRDMARDRCNYFSFWAIFCPFTPLTAQKIKIFKIWKKKNLGDIIILHMCTKNCDQMIYSSWDMVHDRRTNEQTEKVTYRGGYPT